MQAGDAFYLHDEGHLNVIPKIFDDGSVVYCHITSLSARSDKTFVIPAGSHQFVTGDSVFRYDQAQHCEAGSLQLEAFIRTVEQGKKVSAVHARLAREVDSGRFEVSTDADQDQEGSFVTGQTKRAKLLECRRTHWNKAHRNKRNCGLTFHVSTEHLAVHSRI